MHNIEDINRVTIKRYLLFTWKYYGKDLGASLSDPFPTIYITQDYRITIHNDYSGIESIDFNRCLTNTRVVAEPCNNIPTILKDIYEL